MENDGMGTFLNFITRVAVWAKKGYDAGDRGKDLESVSIMGPIVEMLLNTTMEELDAKLEKARREKEQKGKTAVKSLQSPTIDVPGQIVPEVHTTHVTAYGKWRKIIKPPAIVVILGSRGSGKSAVAYRLIEDFRYSRSPYVVGFPEHGKGILPEWMGIEQRLEDVPSKSICIVDEAYLSHHSRDWHKTENRDICRLLNLSRQQDKTIIFIAQLGRQLDIDIVSSADVLIFKNPGMLHTKFDRPEIRDILIDAKRAFQTVAKDPRRWSYIYSHSANFAGLVENELPTFWSTKLSKVYANMREAASPKTASEMTIEEKAQKAKALYQAGWSLSKIAQYFCVSKSTVFNWIHDYPFRK